MPAVSSEARPVEPPAARLNRGARGRHGGARGRSAGARGRGAGPPPAGGAGPPGAPPCGEAAARHSYQGIFRTRTIPDRNQVNCRHIAEAGPVTLRRRGAVPGGLRAARAGPQGRARRRVPAARDRDDRIDRSAPRHARQPPSRASTPGTARHPGGQRRARRLRSAPVARRASVSSGALARRLPARVRIPDRRRPLPPHRQSRSGEAGSARRAGAEVRQADRGRGDRRADRRRALVVDFVDRRHRREGPARDGAGRRVQRPGRLPHRSAAGGQLPRALREVVARRAVLGLRRHPRRVDHGGRPSAAGVPLGRSGDRQGGLLRRERPIAEAVLPEVAAEVRAARDLGVLDPALPSDRPGLQGASRRGLRRADRLVGGRGRRGGRGLGVATAAPAATWCT